MPSTFVGDDADDASEDRENNNIASYDYEYAGDNWQVSEYFDQFKNNLFRFQSVAIANSAAVDTATLRLYVHAAPSFTSDYTVYGDDGSNRQAVWGTTSRYETGMTLTTAVAAFSDTDVTADEYLEIDVTDIVKEIMDDASSPAWSSGDDVRFAVVADDYANGTFLRFRHYWYTSSPDHSFRPELVITTAAGGATVVLGRPLVGPFAPAFAGPFG